MNPLFAPLGQAHHYVPVLKGDASGWPHQLTDDNR